MNQRNGTDVDAGNMMNVFRKLGYTVKVYNDQTAQQIVQVLTAGMDLIYYWVPTVHSSLCIL